MNNKNFQTYFDYGSSKIRAGVFNKNNQNENFCEDSKISKGYLNLDLEIQKIILSMEKNTNEYIDTVNLMIDSPHMLTISISVFKKYDGSILKKEDIQFLIQVAKQQILTNYPNQNILHIIVKNYCIDGNKSIIFPEKKVCSKLSISITFICLPKNIIQETKKLFLKLGISLEKFLCSSYAKASNYKNIFENSENILFVDMGYNRTSITCYKKNEFDFFEILPIGGNHITKDISKILNVDLIKAEEIKLNFDKKENLLNTSQASLELIQKIIFSRIEEILELSINFIQSSTDFINKSEIKLVLMGDGSKILDNKFQDKISFFKEINLLEESTFEICESGLKLNHGSNKQEVVLVPRISKKQGFFEKLFHFFK